MQPVLDSRDRRVVMSCGVYPTASGLVVAGGLRKGYLSCNGTNGRSAAPV